jgi:hypothetical protein
MKRNLKIWKIGGIFFIITTGSLLHFVFEWLNFWSPIGAISPVNESVWEHLKLLFWPLVIFSVLEFKFIKEDSNNSLLAIASMAFIGLTSILVIFYTYVSIIGQHLLLIDISSFIVSVILGQYVSYKVSILKKQPIWTFWISLFILISLGLSFIVFTYFTPEIFIFQDPITGGYGIIEHHYL